MPACPGKLPTLRLAVKGETPQSIIAKRNHRSRKTLKLWHTAKAVQADPLPRQYILINEYLL